MNAAPKAAATATILLAPLSPPPLSSLSDMPTPPCCPMPRGFPPRRRSIIPWRCRRRSSHGGAAGPGGGPGGVDRSGQLGRVAGGHQPVRSAGRGPGDLELWPPPPPPEPPPRHPPGRGLGHLDVHRLPQVGPDQRERGGVGPGTS